MLQIYNTLSRELENFKPLSQAEVKIYYCGPTPYNYAHIGNLRNYLMDDIVVRAMRYMGYRVRAVMNVTDIDDKTIRDSQVAGISLLDFTKKYTDIFLSDCTCLGIVPADTIAPISTLIPDMWEIISGLIKKWYAYISDDGSVYYSVQKFKSYGKLAHLDTAGMIHSVRIDNDEYSKDQIADFALWKAYDAEADGENVWEIHIGEQILKWRPGWHIECSACNMKFFGPQIDIHMGGCDLIFPHHQNEIAQTEAYTGKTFATYWLHGGHLLVDNKKMSKSAKNFYTLQDIVAYMVENAPTVPTQVVYRAFRLMALQNSYRENFNFTWERLTAAVHTIVGLDDMLRRLARYMHTTESTYTQSIRNAHGKLKHPSISREFRDNIQYFTQTFIEKLEADFALPEAMSIVFELQTYINTGIDGDIFSYEELKSIVSLLQSWDSVIYILDFSPLDPVHSVPADVQILLDERILAKSTRDYIRADEIRDILLAQGYRIIDDKNGAYVEKV